MMCRTPLNADLMEGLVADRTLRLPGVSNAFVIGTTQHTRPINSAILIFIELKTDQNSSFCQYPRLVWYQLLPTTQLIIDQKVGGHMVMGGWVEICQINQLRANRGHGP